MCGRHDNIDLEDLPFVSVITPSYNQGKYIQKTIESVLSQDYPNIEHWIVDGGSTDQTIEILKKFEGKINYISERDEGQADAINKGVKLSKGEILLILNSDDYLNEGAVSSAVRWLCENPDVVAVYGECYVVDEHDKILSKTNKKNFNAEQIICAELILPQSSVFFRRSAFIAVGGCDRDIRYCPDYNLWAKMSCKFKMLHVDEYWSFFRENPNSQVAGKRYLTTRQRRLTIKRMLNHPEYSQIVSKLWRRAFASTYLEEANYCIPYGSKSHILSCLIKAVSVYPQALIKYRKRILRCLWEFLMPGKKIGYRTHMLLSSLNLLYHHFLKTYSLTKDKMILKFGQERLFLDGLASLGADTSDCVFPLYTIAKKLEARKIIELGVRKGISTQALLIACKELNGHLWSVDIEPCVETVKRIKSLGLNKFWTFTVQDDLDFIKSWENGLVDVVFIDTSHTYEHTLAELNMYSKLVREGGVLVLHDVNAPKYPGVKRAIKDFLKSNKRFFRYWQIPNKYGLGILEKTCVSREEIRLVETK